MLDSGPVLAASPRIQLDLAGASWAVRAFYDIDSRLPSHRETIGGSGVYALSEAGRRRFGQFPSITADDAFLRRHFQPHERARVESAVSVVTPPRRLKGVIAIKSRSHFGNYEIRELYPELTGNTGQGNRGALVRLGLRPWMWPRLAVYGYVKVAARIRGYCRYRWGNRSLWERDETSRVASTPSSASAASSFNA